MSDLIRFHNVCASRNNRDVLNYLSFGVPRQQISTIYARDSQEREMIIDILCGTQAPDDGKVYLRGESLGTNYNSLLLATVHCVRINSRLIDELTVAENILLADHSIYRFGLYSEKRMLDQIKSILDKTGLDTDMLFAQGKSLTLAQTHIALACAALVQQKELILFENVMDSYSDQDWMLLDAFANRLVALGFTVLFVTHKYNTLIPMSDSVVLIRSGMNVTASGTLPLSRESILQIMIGGTAFPSSGSYEHDIEVPETPPYTIDRTGKLFHINAKKGDVLGLLDQSWDTAPLLMQAFVGQGAFQVMLTAGQTQIRIEKASDARKYGIGVIDSEDTMHRVFDNLNLMDNITLLMRREMDYPLGFCNERVRGYLYQQILSALHLDTLQTLHGNGELLSQVASKEQLSIQVAKWVCAMPNFIFFFNPQQYYDDFTIQEFYDLTSGLVKENIAVVIVSQNYSVLRNACKTICLL